AVIRIVADLADALDAAGRAGLVHRDVKPENVLLDSGSGRALLADFGIARALAVEEAGGVTGQGIAVGTPAYMSPEQAAGESIDVRSDLYSLGILAYEMLAGQPPFRGQHGSAIASRHLSELPCPIERLRPETPAALAAAVMRVLEKNPAARWQTGEEFRRALLRQADAPAGKRPRQSARKWAVGAVLGVAAVLATLAVGNWRQGGPPKGVNARHSVLILPFDNLRQDPAVDWLREGSINILALTLSQWNDLTVVDHERLHDLLAKQHLQIGDDIGLEMARRLAREAGVWTVVLGDYTQAGDSLHLVARVYDVTSGRRVEVARADDRTGADLRPVFDQLASQLLNLSGAPGGIRTDVVRATTTSLEAYRAYLTGIEKLNQWDLRGAEGHLARAVQLDSTFSLAYYKLALTRGWIAGPTDSLASTAIARAAEHAGRLPPHDQTVINAYRAFLAGDFVASRELYRRLVVRDSADADAWYGLGDVWFHDTTAEARAYQRHHTASLRAFKRALALDPDYYLAYEHASWLLNMASRADPEMALMPGDSFAVTRAPDGTPVMDSAQVQEAVRRARGEAVAAARSWATSQPETPRAHVALIDAYTASENFPAALGELGRLQQSEIGRSRPDLPFLQAGIELAAGNPADAERTLQAALDSAGSKRPGSDALSIETFWVIPSAQNTFSYNGHLEEAARAIDFAADARGAVHPKSQVPLGGRESPETWRRLQLAHLYAATGGPVGSLQQIWQSAVEAARVAPARERIALAQSGWPAAMGLFTQTGDPAALKELQALTGEAMPAELQALLALSREDSTAARRLLTGPDAKRDSAWQGRSFWKGYRQPLAAQAFFLLGDYRQTIELLKDFQPRRFETRFPDYRWDMLGRVRLLRGLAYERLGQLPQAQREYRSVLDQWKSADSVLQPYVNKARIGLARVSGEG
ncbi:MAG: protein kinase domain-containing protein, partial [Gemmatimonadales bacterium]